MRRLLLLFFWAGSQVLCLAQNSYTFHAQARAVYDDALRLELDLAEAGIDAIRQREPDNLVVDHLESYVDFFRLYLSGDETLDDQLEERYDRRIEHLETGDPTSPYYRYAIAEAQLHRSLIDLRFERYLTAFRNLNRAHKQLRDNADIFPDFLPTYKDLGLLHAAVGAIPPQFKWGVSVFSSLTGTIPEGRAEMQRALADRDSPFYLETAVLHALLELYLASAPEKASRLTDSLDLRPATNNLHCFVVANIAMRNGRNRRAIDLLEQQQRGGTAADFPYLDFMLGQAKLRDLDARARVHFQSFLLRYPGRHFRKEAQQKIAWSYLLEDDRESYFRTMAKIEGDSQAGGDEHAMREAARAEAPHLGLLRARLLFDGGYFDRARAELDELTVSELSEVEQLERLYRTGRVLGGLQDVPGAISFYVRTIDEGRENPAYYACNAALQAGLLEEDRGNRAAAVRYFNTCLEIDPAEYRTGLHMLAKAGLDRVSD